MKEEKKEEKIINLKSELKKGVSKKGKDYYYIEIAITDKTNKMVMLEQAESELVENKYFK